MDFTYDEVADALYIYFSRTKVTDTEELSTNVMADYDKDGNIVGIEILNLVKRNVDLNHLIRLNQDELIAKVASS